MLRTTEVIACINLAIAELAAEPFPELCSLHDAAVLLSGKFT
jgi:hypothetical protein